MVGAGLGAVEAGPTTPLLSLEAAAAGSALGRFASKHDALDGDAFFTLPTVESAPGMAHTLGYHALSRHAFSCHNLSCHTLGCHTLSCHTLGYTMPLVTMPLVAVRAQPRHGPRPWPGIPVFVGVHAMRYVWRSIASTRHAVWHSIVIHSVQHVWRRVALL